MSDIDIIYKIESLLNIKLVESTTSDYLGKSYTIDSNGMVTGLCLNNCEIRTLKYKIPMLKDLQNLQILNLSDNLLIDISPLKELSNLKNLNLANNQLTQIGSLENLQNLIELQLSGNQLSDISSLQSLNEIEKLRLHRNRIVDISPLEKLTNLTHLTLGENLIEDISALKNLMKLQVLDLIKNPIEELPPWITDFNMDIAWNVAGYMDGFISFYKNPLTKPPIDIIRQGRAAIKDYFKSLEVKTEVVKLHEVRIFLVGDGMAGKTSLLKKIQGLEFKEQESQTHGINVISRKAKEIPGLNNLSDIDNCQIHFWDFGGQEIMHASHQFFLSQRALYILVLDSRTDSKKYYWLKHIEKYGGDSPVIVVMNKIDENPNYNIEQKKLNDNFPNIENRFCRISCKNGEGFPQFRELLGKTIPKTSLFGTEININWIHIRDRLVQSTRAKNYINRKDFIKICEENAVPDESSQHTLLKFLHDLGVVLFFEKLNLASIYVLDPHWVTIGVYKIINSSKTKDGILKIDDLDYILNKEPIKQNEYDPAHQKKFNYDLTEQRYIIDIMKQFELCYEYEPDKNSFIIPDLLPKELVNEPGLELNTPLRFVMKYDYLPSPIISRLMIHLKYDILPSQQWKYGMILESKEFNCQAKIKSDEQTNIIKIIIQGEQHSKRQYFLPIYYNLHKINKSFENLNIEEYIPLPEYPEILIEYQELLGYESAGRDEYFVGKLGKIFLVPDLLGTLYPKNDGYKKGDIKNLFDSIFESILNKIEEENRNVISSILHRLDDSEKRKVDSILQKLDTLQVSHTEFTKILSEIKNALPQFHDKDINTVYTKIEKTDKLDSKLKLTIPIIPILLSLEQEYNISRPLRKLSEFFNRIL